MCVCTWILLLLLLDYCKGQDLYVDFLFFKYWEGTGQKEAIFLFSSFAVSLLQNFSFFQVVEYCPNLRVLNVKDCRDVTEQYLCKLFVQGIWVISDYSLAQMVSRRKRVNYLGLNVQI